MTPERWEQIKRLYDEAQTRPPGERAAFLAQACADVEVRRQVEVLLEQPVSSTGFAQLVGGVAPALAGGVAADVNVGALVGQQLGAYRLDALLGRGGMGEVYAPRHYARRVSF